MKKKLRELLDVSLPIYIIFNLLYMTFGSCLVFNKYLKFRLFSYGYIILLIINVLIILILFFKKKYIKNKIDIFLLLIIVFAIISTIFAFNPMKALFGEWDRYEGLFVICYYITLVFITSYLKKEDRKMIVYFILFFCFIQCIYSFAQKFNLFNVHVRIKKGTRWATGFTSNRNFFGTLMLLCIGYSIGLYIESKEKSRTVLFLFLTFLFSIGLLLSKARSCFVGLIVVMIVLLIYAIKNKYIKKYIILFLVLAFSTSLMQFVNLTPVIYYFNKTTSEISEISKGNVKNEFGSNRIELWKETIKIVPRYLIHGVGIDNFGNVIDGRPIRNYKLKLIYDKAHNEYLQILVTMGIFSLISYLCMHFIIIKEGIVNTFKNKEVYYILPVIGYIVQAQFNISVIEVAPLFYIALGLLINRE